MLRAYSRRDFYAKALALFGLGLLGGIAALVDNWPDHSLVSTAVAQADQAAASATPLRLDLHKFNVSSDDSAPRVAAVRKAATFDAATPIISAAPADTSVTATTLALAVPASSIRVESGLPRGVQFVSASLTDAPELAPVVFMGSVEDHSYWTAATPHASGAVGASVNDGFFTGAVKKTQDTLAKTGSTIADAFRAVGGAVGAVGGAVKRVMPF